MFVSWLRLYRDFLKSQLLFSNSDNHPIVISNMSLNIKLSILRETSIHQTNQPTPLFTYTSDGTAITITGYLGTDSIIDIPSIIDELPVTYIAEFSFQNCMFATGITIPASVTGIGDYAFVGCTALTSVIIPSSVTSIGDYLFLQCSALASATILSPVASIGAGTFYGCSVLAAVTLPESITSIGEYAFLYCTGLPSITIPSSVVSLAQGAFDGCSAFTTITIPASVSTIDNAAFMNCDALISANFLGDAPTIFGMDVFNRTPPEFKIYYPLIATGWTTPTWNGYVTVPV